MIVKITWKRVLAVVSIAAVGGLALAWSGIIHIGASTGHWAITDWFLHWSMRNTVRTHAALTVAEPAADPAGLVSAAGHFAANCAVCHGAPGVSASPTMQAATPHAPDLAVTAATYSDAELFWIIKHGVKFTGMPAWPALERDDEIGRMTAFVRRLPTMSPSDYRDLAYGPSGGVAAARPWDIEDAIAECDRCHADHGRGQADIPIIAGQKARYLFLALEAFATGQRESGVMGAAAARVDEGLRRELAQRYADRDGLEEQSVVADTVEDAEWAERIVAFGLPERDIPPCAECHGQGKRADYPILAGQKATYLAGRLRRWRSDEPLVEARQPSEPMPVIARRLPDEAIDALANYFAELQP